MVPEAMTPWTADQMIVNGGYVCAASPIPPSPLPSFAASFLLSSVIVTDVGSEGFPQFRKLSTVWRHVFDSV